MNKQAIKVLQHIEHKLSLISSQFELYLALGETKERIKTLNKIAPNVFLFFSNALQESIVLGVSRLCDPPQDSRGNKNISIKTLAHTLPSKSTRNRDLHSRLKLLISQIDRELSKIKPIRNKRFSHNDRRTHFSNSHRKIPNRSIDQLLKLIEKFVNEIRVHHGLGAVPFLNAPYPSGDGPDRFFQILQKGLNSQEKMQK